MYYNCLVNIPKNTGKISRNKRGKTTYIEYTYAREYIPEKNTTSPEERPLEKLT